MDAARTPRMTRVCSLPVAGLVAGLAMALPSSGHAVTTSSVPAQPVAATTCIYAGPVTYNGQQIAPQVGVCVPTP